MKIHSSIDIGFRILVHLGRQPADTALTAGQISAAIGISPSQVAQVLLTLRSANYVVAARGRRGGYQIGRSTTAMNLSSLYQFLHGARPYLPHGDGPHAVFFQQAYNAFTGSLLDHSIADIVRHIDARERRDFSGVANG